MTGHLWIAGLNPSLGVALWFFSQWAIGTVDDWALRRYIGAVDSIQLRLDLWAGLKPIAGIFKAIVGIDAWSTESMIPILSRFNRFDGQLGASSIQSEDGPSVGPLMSRSRAGWLLLLLLLLLLLDFNRLWHRKVWQRWSNSSHLMLTDGYLNDGRIFRGVPVYWHD